MFKQFAIAAFLLSLTLQAQPSFQRTLLNAVTSTGASASQDNLAAGISVWRVNVTVSGAPAGCSITVQQSPDNTTWSTVTAGTGYSNPYTCTSNGTIGWTGYERYFRVNLTTLSGGTSPTVTAVLQGFSSGGVSSAVVCGSNLRLLFNDNGLCGSDANLVFNKTTTTLSLGDTSYNTGAYGISFVKTTAGAGGSFIGLEILPQISTGIGNAAIVGGGDFEVFSAPSSTNSFDIIRGIFAGATHFGSGTVTDHFASYFWADNEGTGTVTNAYGSYIHAGTNLGAGSIVNNYGLFIENQSVGTTLNYAIKTNAGLVDFGGNTKAPSFSTTVNCASSGGTCTSAASGAVSIAAGATTVTVSTTAVTANSRIFIMEDSTLGAALSVTCNTTISRTYAVTTRTAATSFVITASAAPVTNPACLSFWIVN